MTDMDDSITRAAGRGVEARPTTPQDSIDAVILAATGRGGGETPGKHRSMDERIRAATGRTSIAELARMTGRLGQRIAAAEAALAETDAAVADAERSGRRDALRTRAAGEKRRDKLAAELERLRMAEGELDRQLVREYTLIRPGGERPTSDNDAAQ